MPRQYPLYCKRLCFGSLKSFRQCGEHQQLFFVTSKDCSPLATVANCSAHPDGLFNPLYFGSTKSSIDHKLLTALAYILMLVLISPVKTRRYACSISRWSTVISSDQSETLQMFGVFKEELKPEISLLHMKVLTLIKAKSNVFL